MSVIIGLCGCKGSGKTTTFEIIQSFLPWARELQLANKLKTVCANRFGVPRETFDDQKTKEKPIMAGTNVLTSDMTRLILDDFEAKTTYNISDDLYNNIINRTNGTVLETPRKIAQFVGTEILREMSPDIHCDFVAKDITDFGVYVVTDIRFLNELEYFKKLTTMSSFLPFYIDREAVANSGDQHKSETGIKELKQYCQVIDSNGTISDLVESVIDVVFISNKNIIKTTF